MALLTFSEFANVLFPYCRNGESEVKFVETLTNKIMEGKPGAKTYDDKCKNPLLNKLPRAKQQYFTGERPIPSGVASIIFDKSDTYKFEEYLRHICSEQRLQDIKADLSARLPEGTIPKDCNDIVPFCADLFVDILRDLASGKADGRRKKTGKS